ncbi:MAG: hypothetical protein PF693_18760 [Spirochaetia bacterium]|nr:hypothetical protein [Spirochaetia bacterium]
MAIPLNKSDQKYTYAEIFASIGDHESARGAADNFELDEDSRVIAYSKIIAALANIGDTDKAQEIFETIIISNENTV